MKTPQRIEYQILYILMVQKSCFLKGVYWYTHKSINLSLLHGPILSHFVTAPFPGSLSALFEKRVARMRRVIEGRKQAKEGAIFASDGV